MTNPNDQTIATYEAHVQEYINGDPGISDIMKHWLGEAIAGLPKTARIIELGSAFGRDAAYLQELGYNVECTDATQAFVDLLKGKGFNARKLNAITDELSGPYDLVLANAVLLHFTREETRQVLQKVYASLAENGTFAFSLKQGEGGNWSDQKLGGPRYFCFWTEGQIRQLLEQTGFQDIRDIQEATKREDKNAIAWIRIIAKKHKK